MQLRIRKNMKTVPFYWLIIIFLQPAFLGYRSNLSIVYDLWHYIEFIAMLYLLVCYVIRDRFKCRIINYILIYYGWMCISCFVSGSTPIMIVWELAPGVGISLYVYYAMKRNTRHYLDFACRTLIIYIVINVITMVLFPDGIASGRIGQTMWFLGGKNVILPFVLACGGMVILRSIDYYGKNTVMVYIAMVLLAASVLFTNSSTAILIAILLAGGVIVEILVRRRLIEKIFSGRNLFLLVAVIFLFVVFASTNSSIAVNITTCLGKDITYNGRTALWAEALSIIRNNPIFGTGSSLVLDVGWGVTMTHAHDLYLNIAAKHGIPAVILLVLCIIRTFRYSKGAGVQLAYYSLALYLVGSVVEVYSTDTLFLLCVTLAIWGENRAAEGKMVRTNFSKA